MECPRRAVLVTAVVVLLLAMAGCASGGDGGETPDPAALQDESATAMESIETGKMTSTLTLSNETHTVETLQTEVTLDRPNRKMRVSVSSESAAGESFEQYYIDDTLYMGTPQGWIEQDATGQIDWDSAADQLGTQQTIPQQATVDVEGTDEFDGHEVYVLTASPDQDYIDSLGPQSGDTDFGEDLDVTNVEITLYVDTDTDHVRRTVVTMSAIQDGEETTATMETTVTSIDEPVTIELPEEAEDAVAV